MASDALTRATVVVAIVATVAALAFAGGSLSSGSASYTETEGPQYDTAALQPDRIPAEGAIEPTAEADGVLLIDDAHDNGYQREDVQPLVAAATEMGFEVRFAGSRSTLREELDNASALVVIDPGADYSEDDAEAVAEFVDDGGRLLLAAEPNRAEVQVNGLVAQINTVRSEPDRLAGQFGIVFGADNLYNLQQNDGNFRNVVATPTDAAGLDGVDRAVVSTPTYVSARNGTPVLTATPGTQRSSTGAAAEHVVAVRSGNVVAVGDADFLAGERRNVADNERLIAELLAFLAE